MESGGCCIQGLCSSLLQTSTPTLFTNLVSLLWNKGVKFFSFFFFFWNKCLLYCTLSQQSFPTSPFHLCFSWWKLFQGVKKGLYCELEFLAVLLSQRCSKQQINLLSLSVWVSRGGSAGQPLSMRPGQWGLAWQINNTFNLTAYLRGNTSKFSLTVHRVCLGNYYLNESWFSRPWYLLCTAKENNNERKLDILPIKCRLRNFRLLIFRFFHTFIQNKIQQNRTGNHGAVWESLLLFCVGDILKLAVWAQAGSFDTRFIQLSL